MRQGPNCLAQACSSNCCMAIGNTEGLARECHGEASCGLLHRSGRGVLLCVRHAPSCLSWRVQGSTEVYITLDGNRMAFARRPGLGAFLARVAQLFEVVVFTAGSKACSKAPPCPSPMMLP